MAPWAIPVAGVLSVVWFALAGTIAWQFNDGELSSLVLIEDRGASLAVRPLDDADRRLLEEMRESLAR